MVARDRHLKIIIVGPAGCGKTVLANLLADQVDLTTVSYRPTIGVRILETDVTKTVTESSFPRRLPVQLWDVGGKIENQQYWNACLYGAEGCLIVYDGDRSGQDKDLESLLYYFTQRPESTILKPIPMTNVLCIANHKTSRRSQPTSSSSRLPPGFTGKVAEVQHSSEDEPAILKSHFTKFINEITENKL